MADLRDFLDGESLLMGFFILLHIVCMELLGRSSWLPEVSDYVIVISFGLFIFCRIGSAKKWLKVWMIDLLNVLMCLAYVAHWQLDWFAVPAA